MVYTYEGVSSYYRNSRGNVPSLFGARIVDLWRWTRRVDPDDYDLFGATTG